MTLLVESMPSIVDRMPPREAAQYLKMRSDVLEARYQALMEHRATEQQRGAFIRSVSEVIDRAIATDSARQQRRTAWTWRTP